jgi:ribosomal protein L19
VERSNVVRRARMYFLRDRTGKGARLKQKFS